MNAVTPVSLTMPDGVSRELRFTLGARKRIHDRFGMDLHETMEKHDAGALPEILFALMHDAKGKPPADITVEELAESLSADSTVEIMAAIMSSATQGKVSKNELEPLILKTMQEMRNKRLSIGSTSGALELDALVSQTSSSGGDTLSAKSEPESSDGNSKSAAGTTGLVQ